jgi:hypothetical protein
VDRHPIAPSDWKLFVRAFPREVNVKSVSAIDSDGKVLAKSPDRSERNLHDMATAS